MDSTTERICAGVYKCLHSICSSFLFNKNVSKLCIPILACFFAVLIKTAFKGILTVVFFCQVRNWSL
jgi:hypothetical protein